MKHAFVLLALGACGRIGFDPQSSSGDGSVDADVPVVETVGVLDPAFGTGGQTVLVRGTEQARMFDVRPRVGGYFSYGRVLNAGVSLGQLLAWTPDGDLDTGFSTDGVAGFGPELGDWGYGLLPLADGRWVLVGDGYRATPGYDDMFLVMIGSDGVLDPGFGPGNGSNYYDFSFDDSAYRAVETSRGIVACGVTQRGLADTHHVLVGIRLDGAVDTGFGVGGIAIDDAAGPDDTCLDAVVDSAERIVTIGTSGPNQIVTRYDSLGARDGTFSTGGRLILGSGVGGEGRAVAIAPDGDIVVVGSEQDAGLVVRLAPDGTPRTTFGQGGVATYRLGLTAPGADVVFYDVLVQPNGKIVAVGYRRGGGASALDGVVVRMLGDGSLDPTFGTGGMIVLDVGPDDTLNAVYAESGGLIVVGDTTTASLSRAWIVRLR
jgi:uncharacterized delta-60 repeat protein